MMAEKRCTIRRLSEGHSPITLLDNTPLTLGRGPETKIREARCSRVQVLLVANYAENVVNITQVGKNASGYNGVELSQNKSVYANHGETFDVLLGKYTYIIEFNPPPGKKEIKSVTSSSNNVNEVSDSDDEDTQPLMKRLKVDEVLRKYYWEQLEGKLLIYKDPQSPKSSKIAAYDLDHTLICPKNKAVFPKNEQDWKFNYECVPEKLRDWFNKGYKIAIFTNQSTLTSKPVVSMFKTKIDAIAKLLNIPFELYAARHFKFRKPCTFMWEEMLKRNGGVKVDKANSFYCGDAAGRPARMNAKADHSEADILFAANLDVQFELPEKHFLNCDKFKLPPRIFDPKNYSFDVPLCDPPNKTIMSPKQELILMVGAPGSGKSTFVKNHLTPAYKSISRDNLQSMSKCLSMAEAQLKIGSRVVIDNTNMTVKSRSSFIQMAAKLEIPVRAFVMKTDNNRLKHNLKFRELTDDQHSVVTSAILHSLMKGYEAPQLQEGFQDIVHINFWPTFRNKEEESLYSSHLIEKYTAS